MLKTYIFNDLESNWIEEKNSLLKHDLCVVLDDEHSMIYLWRGPKSSKDKHIKAINALNLLTESRPELNIKLNEKEQKFPPQVRKTIQNLLKAKENDVFHSKYIFSRFITIRVYLLMLIISISLPLISLLNLGSFISWIPSGSNFIVLTETYNTWLIISVILTIITIFIFSFSIMIGILEQESEVIIFSIIGLTICIGIFISLQQGIFLFIFQDGSTEFVYLINKEDLYLFFSLIVISTAIFLIPNIIKLINLFKTYRKFIF